MVQDLKIIFYALFIVFFYFFLKIVVPFTGFFEAFILKE
jgi:hypothetical protein